MATEPDLRYQSVEGLLADLNRWSARCVEAGAFPPNAYKRAAG